MNTRLIRPIWTLSLLTAFSAASLAQVATDQDYLEHALEAERFIASLRVDGAHGALWRSALDSNEEPGHSMYYGSSGIAIFYLELHRATGERRFLETALSAGDEILATVQQGATETITV